MTDLGAGVLAPRRDGLAAALACATGHDPARTRELVDGCAVTWIDDGVRFDDAGGPRAILRWKTTDPRAAWEQLATAGVIPDGWVEDPQRAFTSPGEAPCRRCGGDGLGTSSGFADEPPDCYACGGRGSAWSAARAVPHPPDVAACLALAADAPGVLAAETLAREAVERLAPWGVPQPQRVVWRVVDATSTGAPYYYDRPAFLNQPASALIRNGSRGWVTTRDETPRAAWENAHATARMLRADWKTQSAAGRRVAPPSEYGAIAAANDALRALWKRRLRDLPNPFEPVVGVWETGYALHEITEQAAVLVASAL